jgi:hypothetical protein
MTRVATEFTFEIMVHLEQRHGTARRGNSNASIAPATARDVATRRLVLRKLSLEERIGKT